MKASSSFNLSKLFALPVNSELTPLSQEAEGLFEA